MALPLLAIGGLGLLGGLAGGASALAGSGSQSRAVGSSNRGVRATGNNNLPSQPRYAGVTGTDINRNAALDREIAARDKEIAALQAQLEAIPRLPIYNTTEAWARAERTATAAVNPVYQDKLNNALAKFNQQRRHQKTVTKRGKEDLDIQQRQLMEDLETQRQRTSEDVEAQLAESRYQEALFQDVEGTQFDRANRQARTELAQAGLTMSGLGQQQLAEMEAERNLESADRVRSFENERAAQELFRTRTFEDLDIKGKRGEEATKRAKKDLDIELDNFLKMVAFQEREFRWQNEQDRLAAIAQATTNAYNTEIRNWLSNLANEGWRPQDIQAAYQTYGR